MKKFDDRIVFLTYQNQKNTNNHVKYICIRKDRKGQVTKK